jgi:uncharacterized protein YndB with AHSA1/START domain
MFMPDVFLTGMFLAAILLAGVVLYARSRPNAFHYARSLDIAASPEKIFPLIDDPKVFNTLNPFVLKDAATKLSYRGTARGKGAICDWDGNRHAGKGSIEITESVPSSGIVMRLDMVKPMKASNRVEFTLVPKGEATTVTWAMSGDQPLMAKLMTLVVDCDKMVGGEFETGLANIKAAAER